MRPPRRYIHPVRPYGSQLGQSMRSVRCFHRGGPVDGSESPQVRGAFVDGVSVLREINALEASALEVGAHEHGTGQTGLG